MYEIKSDCAFQGSLKSRFLGTGSITGISNTKCGIKKAGTKIVGGEETNVSFY